MSKSLTVTALTGFQIVDVVRVEEGWVVSADGPRRGACPSCGTASAARHGSYRRSLHDLPAQGSSVIIDLAITRLKCVNQRCHRRTFSATVAQVAGPGARMTSKKRSRSSACWATCASPIHRNPKPRLHGLLHASGALHRVMATRGSRGFAADYADSVWPACSRPGNRTPDIATDCQHSLYPTASTPDASANCCGRRIEGFVR